MSILAVKFYLAALGFANYTWMILDVPEYRLMAPKSSNRNPSGILLLRQNIGEALDTILLLFQASLFLIQILGFHNFAVAVAVI